MNKKGNIVFGVIVGLIFALIVALIVALFVGWFLFLKPESPVSQADSNVLQIEKTNKQLQNGKPFRGVWNGLEHPVIRLMILGFQEACEKYEVDCVVMGGGGFEDSTYIQLLEQSVAQGASGMVVGTYGPFRPVELEAIKQGIPVVGFHTPMKEGEMPGLLAWVATDVTAYGKAVADAMADKLQCTGPIAVTQNTYNDTENEASRSFIEEMKVKCPNVEVLTPELEGGDQPSAIAKAGAILIAHPDIKGAFGTTGGSPTTWAKALEQAGRNPGDVIVVGMDYVRQNLDLIKSGWVYAVVGQPIYEETFRAVEILIAKLKGEPVEFNNIYPSPIITINEADKYYGYADRVDARLKEGK
jgi:ribose transport system substrate-binding protein